MDYVNGGTSEHVGGDLPAQVRRCPRLIEEHCRDVAIEAGAQVAATIRSWFPSVDGDFIKEGAHPDTTEEKWQQLLDSSIDPVTGLLADMCVNPGRLPLAADLQRPGLSIDEDDDDEDELDPAAILRDDLAPSS